MTALRARNLGGQSNGIGFRLFYPELHQAIVGILKESLFRFIGKKHSTQKVHAEIFSTPQTVRLYTAPGTDLLGSHPLQFHPNAKASCLVLLPDDTREGALFTARNHGSLTLFMTGDCSSVQSRPGLKASCISISLLCLSGVLL